MLRWIESHVTSEAAAQLPPPGPEHQGSPARIIEAESPQFGRVRITFLLASHRHYKTTRWRWSMEWAVLVKEKPPEGG